MSKRLRKPRKLFVKKPLGVEQYNCVSGKECQRLFLYFRKQGYRCQKGDGVFKKVKAK